MGILKWLHLSDFHFGKDGYDERRLCAKITELLRGLIEEGKAPDAIFVTGDIAYSGLPAQYDEFETLLLEMDDAAPAGQKPRVYVVPGNHDVDYTKNSLIEGSLYQYAKNKTFSKLLDPTEEGYRLREQVIPRFWGFQKTFQSSLCHPPEGLFSPKGYFLDAIETGGRSVGIAGVNTAWLSHGKEDRENLTPGARIVEEAVEALGKYRHRILLGHHPLSWFQPKEQAKLASLLAKNAVIYLYGHVHVKEGGVQIGASGQPYLHFGSGAAFLTRETDNLRHSVQYGELDDGGVRLRPFRWSEDQQEWLLDSPERYPAANREADCWFFPFPAGKACRPVKRPKALGREWFIIERSFVEKRAKESPSEEDMLMFFDGRPPEVSFVFSPQIPVREKTKDYVNEFLLSQRNGKSKCMLLTGAGGEGKSTLSLQVIQRLAMEDWTVLYCQEADGDAAICLSDIEGLDGPLLIAADDASRIAPKLYQLLCDARRQGRVVHLLLVSVWFDWTREKADALPWSSVSDFSSHAVAGLEYAEAEAIVQAWSRYGEPGLGALSAYGDLSRAAQELYQKSRPSPAGTGRDGALLGAIISTRYRDEYYMEHVRQILRRLQNRPLELPGTRETLLEAFARIALMHREGLYILRADILAEIYHCKRSDIKGAILAPLKKEAVTSWSGGVIYIRHDALARCVVTLVEEEFDDIPLQDYFPEMAAAAVTLRVNGNYVYEMESWRYLASHFLNKGMKPLAVRVAEAVYGAEPQNDQVLSHLVHIYLSEPDPDSGIAFRVLSSYGAELYDEWLLLAYARVAGHMNRQELRAYLTCVALSDQSTCITAARTYTQKDCEELAGCLTKLPDCRANPALAAAGRAFTAAGAVLADRAAGRPEGLRPFQLEELGRQMSDGARELLELLGAAPLPPSVPRPGRITYGRLLAY